MFMTAGNVLDADDFGQHKQESSLTNGLFGSPEGGDEERQGGLLSQLCHSDSAEY